MEQTSFFEDKAQLEVPLATRMRPRSLEEFAGQRHLLGEGKVLRRLIEGDRVSSMIFWGPPGVGKTTLARIIAGRTRSHFINFSAVTSGIKEIKQVMEQAEHSRRLGERTILFVDEIHRFNKAQQDAFLPYVEKGSIVLIGATTENPSFEVNAALLSRCRVFVLQALSQQDLEELLRRALSDPRGFGGQDIRLEEGVLEAVASFANGDARTALSTLEMVVLNGDQKGETTLVTRELLEQCTSRRSLLYDKNGEEHYNLISALHKSMRNSDPDAAVYWLSRMLEAGEDPLYVARRLIRFASEDVGPGGGGGRLPGLPLSGHARVQRPPDPRGGVPVPGAQVQQPVRGLRDRQAGRPEDAGGTSAAADSQRPYPADEGPALRGGLPVRSRHPGETHRHGVPARLPAGEGVLPAHGPGQRSPGQRAPGAHQSLERGAARELAEGRQRETKSFWSSFFQKACGLQGGALRP